jgi:cell division protein FtsI/penicillin-binding protein 2
MSRSATASKRAGTHGRRISTLRPETSKSTIQHAGEVRIHPALRALEKIDKSDRRRLKALLAVILVMAAAEIARLVQLQGLEGGRFRNLATQQRYRVAQLSTPRGDIVDRNGKPLAISVPAKTVVANPSAIADKEKVALELSRILGAPYQEVLERISGDGKFVYVARKIDESTADRVAASRLEGITLVEEPTRRYPGGSLAAPVLGFVGTDNLGLEGLELGVQELLAGRPGSFAVEQDPQGRPIPQAEYHFEPPVPGSDVMITIDSEVQYRAEALLGAAVERYKAKGGSILVMEVGTGDILAMANLPTFDPNEFWKSQPEGRRNRLAADVFEPGSTNKVITAAAALEEHAVGQDERIGIPNRYRIADAEFKDAEDHPPVSWTVRDIVVHSSNIGTIKVAQRLGPEKLDKYLRAFGYGRPTGIPVPGEAQGILLPVEKWWSTSIGTVPIGQGIAVTGLQLAQVYATVANDGIRVTPRLVKGKVVDRKNMTVEELAPTASPVRVISPETAQQLREILAGVVAEGTGKRAAVVGHQVAGKTGTARKPSETGGYLDQYVASFVGFAPVDEPRFVVAVILDEPVPYYGGLSSAPVFSEIMGFVLKHYNVAPSGDQKAFARGSSTSSLEDSIPARDSATTAISRRPGG